MVEFKIRPNNKKSNLRSMVEFKIRPNNKKSNFTRKKYEKW